MKDAADALRAAIVELDQARASLPADLAGEIEAVIEEAQALLGSVGSKLSDDGADRPRDDASTA